jgi:hypothetical protein
MERQELIYEEMAENMFYGRKGVETDKWAKLCKYRLPSLAQYLCCKVFRVSVLT